MLNDEANVNLKFPRSEHLPSSLPMKTGVQRGTARPFDLSTPFDKLKAPQARGPGCDFA